MRGFQHFESQTMARCPSLRLLYKVHSIELDLQSQLHQAVLFSHYSSTELSKERLFLVEILQPAFQGLATWKCHPFYRTQQSNTQNVFGSLMTIITNLPPAHGHVGCLFLIFCIHFIALSIILRALSLCIFTKISRSTINFKTEKGSRLTTEYYAFTIMNYSCWSS